MATGKPRVLCVDDEPYILAALTRVLSGSYDVERAPSGAEALALLANRPPFDVVIADMRMPGMSGLALLARVRATAGDTVRILLTGDIDDRDATAAVADGTVTRFLTKPCPNAKLREAVELALHERDLGRVAWLAA